MSNRQSPVVWGVLLFSLALRLAMLAAILAFLGWVFFRVFQDSLAGGFAMLVTLLLVGGIAAYVGGRLARKQMKSLEEYQERLRAKREAAGGPSDTKAE